MWTLSEIRDKLSERLGETSTTFWTAIERTGYINEGQRFVASLTRGVPSTVSQVVNTSTPTIALPGKTFNAAATMGEIDGGRVLPVVTIERANLVSPNWRSLSGRPFWIVLDIPTATARVTPVPSTDTNVSLTVSIYPSDLSSDSDELFNGTDAMEKYQGVVLNMAASLALLKERYDGDAERFYQFAIQELQQLGISPQEIPPFRQVVEQNG